MIVVHTVHVSGSKNSIQNRGFKGYLGILPLTVGRKAAKQPLNYIGLIGLCRPNSCLEIF